MRFGVEEVVSCNAETLLSASSRNEVSPRLDDGLAFAQIRRHSTIDLRLIDGKNAVDLFRC